MAMMKHKAQETERENYLRARGSDMQMEKTAVTGVKYERRGGKNKSNKGQKEGVGGWRAGRSVPVREVSTLHHSTREMQTIITLGVACSRFSIPRCFFGSGQQIECWRARGGGCCVAADDERGEKKNFKDDIHGSQRETSSQSQHTQEEERSGRE